MLSNFKGCTDNKELFDFILKLKIFAFFKFFKINSEILQWRIPLVS